MNENDILSGFLQIMRKPFSGETFISLSGLNPSEAESVISAGVADGRINLVQGNVTFETSVFVRKPPLWQKPVRDWAPRRNALVAVLQKMEPEREYRAQDIRHATGFSIRSVERYLAMLAHLGCVARRIDSNAHIPGRPRYFYTITARPLPESIPRYYFSGVGKQKQS